MPGDNTRWATVHVKDSLNILLVDGEPSSRPFEGETDCIALVFDVLQKPYRVETVTDSTWTLENPDASPWDVVVLANVAAPTSQQADWLTRLVKGGAGLVTFCGDQMAPDIYNRLLYKDGTGVLPAALDGAADSEALGMLLEDLDPAPLPKLKGMKAASLEAVRPRRIELVRVGADKSAIRPFVVARWNDPSGSPAAIEKEFGAGRSLLWTITADFGWSDWPGDRTRATYMLAIDESVNRVARVAGGNRNLVAGSPIRRSASDSAGDPQIETPTGKEILKGRTEGEGVAGAKVLIWDDTRTPGFYKLGWLDGQRTQEEYAVSPDSRESDLRRIPAGELKELFGALNPEVIARGASSDGSGPIRGQEIWRGLAAVLLGLLALEAAFATFTGRQR
jgi:hypothetical protein